MESARLHFRLDCRCDGDDSYGAQLVGRHSATMPGLKPRVEHCHIDVGIEERFHSAADGSACQYLLAHEPQVHVGSFEAYLTGRPQSMHYLLHIAKMRTADSDHARSN